MIFNRYNKHHEVLKFLNEKYFKHEKESVDLYCFSLDELSKKIKQTRLKTEKILIELKEFDCVNSRKTENSYKISENGIKKYKSQYFLDKQKEYFKSSLKDFLGITVSVFAIATFFITIGLKQTESNKSDKKEMKELQKEVKDIKILLKDNPNLNHNILTDTLKTDSLKTD